ncbi:MAG: PAS domain S-box protein [Treponemataceae bacterium]|nr:PAS domain S-box protein [Treponemataceae bacterium]
MKNNEPISILFASSIEEEKERFDLLVEVKRLPYQVYYPKDFQEADHIISTKQIAIIITDTSFSAGAFADWLSLWPYPYILLAYYGEEEIVDELIQDEACSFVMRDPSYRHLGCLPTMIRKVLNIRESVERQNAHLRISEQRYMELVSSIPDIVYTLDGKGHFTYINDAISQLGYTPLELIGKHFSTILAEEEVPRVSRKEVLPRYRGIPTGPERAPKLFDERRRGPRMTRHLVVKLKPKISSSSDMTTTAVVYSYGEVAAVGIELPEYEGMEVGTVGIIRDVTQRKKKEIELENELYRKDMLLREIYHRIKNNLQVIASLIRYRCDDLQDEQSKELFQDLQNKIEAIALVHEQLYSNRVVGKVNIKEFLSQLVELLQDSYSVDRTKVQTTLTCEAVQIDSEQALPLTLLLIEILNESYQYGIQRRGGEIHILLHVKKNTFLRLTIDDNRVGIPPSETNLFRMVDIRLIKAFVDQLHGSYQWNHTDGSHFELEFSLPRRKD